MPENLYRCSCGKMFKTAQGLAGHQRFCKKGVRQSEAKEGVAEWTQRVSKLQEDYAALSAQYTWLVKRLNKLDGIVNELVGYVCPAGKNMVGVASSRTIELSFEMDKLRKELTEGQRAFEREITGFIAAVLPK